MSTVQTFYDSQLTNEKKKYSTDFGDFLPSGASIASAGSTTATYQQTFNGSASGSMATSVTGGSIVTFQTPALSAVGTYTYTVSASPSDGQVRSAVWYVTISK